MATSKSKSEGRDLYWNALPQDRGQIVGSFYAQAPGAAEGPAHGFGRMSAWFDASDRSWEVKDGRKRLRGSGDMPTPEEARRRMREASGAAICERCHAAHDEGKNEVGEVAEGEYLKGDLCELCAAEAGLRWDEERGAWVMQ